MFLNGESTANSSATSRNEVYFIVRKSTENREIVEFELAQAWDYQVLSCLKDRFYLDSFLVLELSMSN